MLPALAHAAAKRELVAAQRPPGWMPPSMFRPPEILTEAEVVEAEAELKTLQRHALELERMATCPRCGAEAHTRSPSAAERMRLDWERRYRGLRHVGILLHVTEIEALVRKEYLEADGAKILRLSRSPSAVY